MLSNLLDFTYLQYLGFILVAFGFIEALRFQKKPFLAFFGLCCIDIGYAAVGLAIGTDISAIGGLVTVCFNFTARILGLIALYRLTAVARQNNTALESIAKACPYTAAVFALSMFSAIEISPFFTSDAKHLILYGSILQGNPLNILSYGYTFFLTAANIAALTVTLLFVHNLFQGSQYTYSPQNFRTDVKTSSALQHLFLFFIIILGLLAHNLTFMAANFYFDTKALHTQLQLFAIHWNHQTFLLYTGAFLVLVCGYFLPIVRKPLALLLTLAALGFTVLDANLLPLAYFFSILVSFMAIIVTVYSFGYIKKNENCYYFLLLLMFGSVLGLLSSISYGSFFIFWEIMTISSYILVAFDDTPKAHYAAKKYFLMSGIGALIMLPGLLLLQQNQPYDINAMLSSGFSAGVFLYTCIIALFIGLGVKAGIFPFQSWLPDAHPAAPASISAPLSGILTKTGLYGFIFFFFIIMGYGLLNNSFVCPVFKLPSIGVLSIILGTVTMFYGEIKAYKATEIKKLFAYSTIGQIGEICITLGVFTYIAATAALLHIFNHAIMKDLIFLCTGAFLLRSGFSKIEDLKGLGREMPFTGICMVIGLLSILGLPPLAGFNSKFLMLFALAEYNPHLSAVMLFASLIGCVYYTRIIRILIFEKYTGPRLQEASLSMQAAMGILAFLCILFGLYPQLVLDNLIQPVAEFIALRGGFNLSEHATTLLSYTSVTWKSPSLIILTGAILPILVRKNPVQCGIASVMVLGLATVSLVATQGQYDTLSFIFALAITVIGATTACYSIGYMEHSHSQWRYYSSFLCMCGGLVGVATSTNLYSFFFFWEIMSSWTLYFVIIHEETKESLWEGFKYFLFNMIGAGFLFLGVILVIHWLGTADFAQIKENFSNINAFRITVLITLLAIGFLMKAAQLPFRIDIQMHPATAPTPVSGYISAVLLKSATFGLLKLFMVLGGVELFKNHISLLYIADISVYIGAVTIVMAAAFAIFQQNIKLVLIYSSVSQLGYMVVGISLGTSLGVAGGILHLVNHLLFKDLLFLVAGVILAQTHIYSMNRMGGLALKMPKTFALFIIGAICVIGLPPSNGFTSKWIIYHALMDKGYVLPAILSLVGSVLTLAYMTKFMHSVFLGQVKPDMEKTHEAPKTMLIPMILLSIGCIVTSVFPGLVLLTINKVLMGVGLQPLDVAPWGINSGKGAWNATLTAVLFIAVWYIGQRTLKKFSKQQRITTIHTCGMPSANFSPSTAQDIYSTNVLFGTNENK